MKRRAMMKKTIAAFILTAFLSVNFSAAEAAPGKKVYPYPDQQQSQQSSRPAARQSRPVSPRPSIQQSRSGSPRPAMQQQKPAPQRQTVQQPKPVSQRQTVQQPKPATHHQTVQQPKPATHHQTVQQPKPVSQHQTVQQPKPATHHPAVQQPKHTEASHERVRPKEHNPKQDAVKPKIREPKHHDPDPKMHEHRHEVSKPKIHKPEHWKHGKPGPRKDLHRPPVYRTHKNMHEWRRAPRIPRDYWWNHRPAHRWGRYRGYYNGIYYNDVLSALLAAEIIHSVYVTEQPAKVVYYKEDSTRSFIPKEAIKYNGHHYHVFSDIGKTMEEAQQFCESMGGHLATVGDDSKNERLYRLINDSGYDNEYFEKYGNYRMIPNEPVTYVKADQESSSEEDVFYGMYYWNYKNLTEAGTTDGTGGNAFVCEWDK